MSAKSDLLLENIRLAWSSVRSNWLRTILTIMIIALGIAAMVGILTAIDAIKASISANFTNMGANTFTLRNKGQNIRIGKDGKRPVVYRTISLQEALVFKDRFSEFAPVSVSGMGTFNARLQYLNKETNPNINVFGADENYLLTMGYQLQAGRNFSIQEMNTGQPLAILGEGVANQLFKNYQAAIGKFISINGVKYQVTGILEEKGSSMGFGGDRYVILPIQVMRQHYNRQNLSWVINVIAPDAQLVPSMSATAEGIFRIIRKVKPGEESNFEVIRSDNLAGMLIENTAYVTLAATIIGVITLLGAAIGLMNIMLVAVTERTREIGTRKAIGATQKMIREQFLAEAILICQVGGIMGILLGILIGNVVSSFLDAGFIIPWKWIIGGIALCYVTGLAAGIYPAGKAAKVDPIESLRAE